MVCDRSVLVGRPRAANLNQAPYGACIVAPLGSLDDNGGPTNTHLPSSSSPLVDAGSDVGFKGVNTLLTAAVSGEYGSQTLSVDDASGFPNAPFLVRVGSEMMRVTQLQGNTLSVERGACRTWPEAHSVGATVVYGFEGLNTLVSASIDDTTSQLTVAATVGLPSCVDNFDIRVNDEEMTVDATTIVDNANGTLTFTVSRGANGTSAAAHVAGSNVLILTDQRGYSRFVDGVDIGAVELGVGEGGATTPLRASTLRSVAAADRALANEQSWLDFDLDLRNDSDSLDESDVQEVA